MNDSDAIDPRRVFTIRDGEPGPGPVVYWMSRDQRVNDNWALLHAVRLADRLQRPLAVVFALAPRFLDATRRHYEFMLAGLQEVEKDLHRLHIPFFLLLDSANRAIPEFADRHDIAALVTDFAPLRINRQWQRAVADTIRAPFYRVDAHNIVPCTVASDKQEYAAYTIRKKIHRLLPEFLTEFPPMRKPSVAYSGDHTPVDWTAARRSLRVDESVKPIDWLRAGSSAALEHLNRFLAERLPAYDEKRNDPNAAAQSDLSPYLHFGQISGQRVALAAQHYDRDITSQEAFLEQVIVRRELSDNFCWFNDQYDSFDGFPDWGKKTLDEHRSDPREYLYSLEQFEQAETHDPLWNAAQTEMVVTGKMHGYMRMLWAKKILEWSPSPEEAIRIATTLNDRYSLDGRDPNGYVGIAWSIGGVHDRPWFERDIFGKVRFMSSSGAARKFDVPGYIERVNAMAQELVR